uniref:Uncharacterized protein n=1 Tax=Glossina morsitans morsitans TaxID=37546 RepID=A0A1B0FP99_GLOMM
MFTHGNGCTVEWGANIDDRRSFTEYAFVFGNAAVSWERRRQLTVAMCSTEAEYMSLFESTEEVIHLRSYISEILGKMGTQTTTSNVNQGTNQLSKNPVFHKRTKPVDH